jgi:hypothetical protein
MTIDRDAQLRARLAALEATAPTGEPPAARMLRRRRGSIALSIPAAALLLVALAATAAGAIVVANLQARGTDGVENPGQPLAGANLECMSPPEAAAYLAAHGFAAVVWQVERGDVATKNRAASTQAATPPDHGYVIPGAIVDGTLYMVVDQRQGATGVGACFGRPMP